MFDYLDDYRPKFDGYRALMPHRVRHILLVSSLYDAFVMEEDASLLDQIWEQYVQRRITLPPSIIRVSSLEKALERLEEPHFDLVLALTRSVGRDSLGFARAVKDKRPEVPVVLLATDRAELGFLPPPHERQVVDKVFLWNNDSEIFLAAVKYVEDVLNVDHDIEVGNVRVIMLVEDSIPVYSRYLPTMYTEIMNLTRNLIDEGLNPLHKQLRMRSRAKILHAETYEDAVRLLDRYGTSMLGVLSDVSFWRDGRIDDDAGYDLVREIKRRRPLMPVALHSASPDTNRDRAWSLGAEFLDKHSANLLDEMRGFLKAQMGFGDFVFRMPDGREIARASNIYELLERLREVPVESIILHAEHNHFSNWLAARTETTIADEIAPRKKEEFDSDEAVRTYIIAVISNVLRRKGSDVVAEFTASRRLEFSDFMHLGKGSMGGKGRGIAFVRYLLNRTGLPDRFPGIRIDVPPTLVVGASEFSDFLDGNDLREFAIETDDAKEISGRFAGAEVNTRLVELLASYVSRIRSPLAVRSSSILEDSHTQPFAGLYATCMVPNTGATTRERLADLLTAVKMVWASTFFPDPKSYFETIAHRIEEERMAVVIQELVGRRHGAYFYPTFSGVAQSHNFYPVGPQTQDDGIAHLAVGLGKTIVDGETVLRFSPAHPHVLPQYATPEDWLDRGQKRFYALHMDRGVALSPPVFEDNLVSLPISVAEEDGELTHIASVYSPDDNMLRAGLAQPGPRVVTFSSVLKGTSLPFTQVLRSLLEAFHRAMGSTVEMEFAVNLGKDPEVRLLQLRPLSLGHAHEAVDVPPADWDRAWCRTGVALGNGCWNDIRDIVYVRPDSFERSATAAIAREVGDLNRKLADRGTPYVLLGFGRWGSSDPWLGIGVSWAQISGARIIVEAARPDFRPDPSQGAHFFHNMTSLGIGYLTVGTGADGSLVDWNWLESLPVVEETVHVRHVRSDGDLHVKIDGRSGRAVLIAPGRSSPCPERT